MERLNSIVLPSGPGEPVRARSVQTGFGRWWDRHDTALRMLAVLTLGWNAAYLVWRVGWSWDGANPVMWALLLVCEVYGVSALSVLAWFSWRRPDQTRPPATPGRTVDVYVCTFDEPVAVLRATLTGCRRIAYPHTTYLLDDGRRPEMAALAEEFGAIYLTRPDNRHAKAGNVNHALRRSGGELVFTLDADHVPTPDALDALVGYFDDPELALVQTPHDFFNQDSAQHYEPGRHEQSVFFSVVMPGKDRHGGAFWCGSAALIRRAALLQIGGVATETIAEDFHTTLRLHRHGWRTRYHAETVVQGLAPHSLASYLLQRDRWARGNLTVFRTPESPLRRRGLTAWQRLSYLASLNAYLAGPVRALLLVVLAAVLWTGAMPLATGWTQLLALWLPATASSVIAGSALSRGFMRAKETFHFEITCAQTHLRALPSALRTPRRAAVFKVTPKVGLDTGGWSALRQLKLPIVLAAVLAAGLVGRLLAGAELVRLPALPGIAVTVVPAVAAIELYRLLRTLRVHHRRRQYRAAFRFPCQTAVRLNKGGPSGEPVVATLIDINTGGAGLIAPAPLAPGTPVALSMSLPDAAGDLHRVESSAIITSCRAAVHNHRVGVRFVNLDAAGTQVLTEYCFVVASFRRLRAIPAAARQLTTAPAATTASAG